MEEAIVKVEHLSHRYSVQWAIRDINFEITKIRSGKNEIVAKQLRSEIKRAFKKSKLRIEFVNSVLKELNRKCTFKEEKDRLSANIETAKNLAHFFGLRISESHNQ